MRVPKRQICHTGVGTYQRQCCIGIDFSVIFDTEIEVIMMF